MKRFGLLVLLSVLTFSISPCRAEIPKLINYQGMLTDDSGSPLTDTVDVTFIIYDDPGPTGGNIKWEETQYDVSVINGLFNVILGTSNPIDLPFDQDYWLDITVQGEHMPARLRFTSVGYAYRAMVADTAYATTPGAGSNWAVSDSVLYTNKKWGIARGGAGNVLYGDSAHTHVNLGAASVTGNISGDFENCTVAGGEQNTAGSDYATVGGGFHNVVSSIGGGGVIGGGSNNSITRGMATVGGGYDNQSDAPYATIGGGWSNRAYGDYFAPTIAGGWENITLYPYATVGGGHKNTAAAWGATVPGGEQDSAVGNFSFAAGYRAKALHAGSFVWADSTDADFYSTGDNSFNVRATGGVYSISNNNAYGARFENSGSGDGIRAYANSSSGNNYGAVYAVNNGTSPSIYAKNDGSGYAAYLDGTVEVVGYLYKTGGGFKIDHPLEPENKYLYHAFVESPDMMDIYNGNVTLGAGGEAWVELPGWFQALNRDFRYQLTCIGAFAPVYIAEKISDNRFKIAGGQPGTQVSWQVTGIRQDVYAEKHRIPVEGDKPAAERGKYLYPEAYGMPENMSVGYSGDKDRIR